MYDQKQIKRYGAIIIISILAIFLAIALSNYINVIFGALIIVTLFTPLYNFFIRKKLTPKRSAILICIISTIIIAIPLSILSGLLINETSQIVSQSTKLLTQLETLDQTIPQIELTDTIKDVIRGFGNGLRSILIGTVNQITQTIINLIILYFLIFYMLVHQKEALQGLRRYIPFSKNNTEKLVEAFKRITNTTVLGAGIVAIVQGIIMSVGLALIGIPNPILLGFVTAVLSFLPLLGVALVWVPVAVIELVNNSYWGFAGALITGGVLTLVDYAIRARFQKTRGQIHPLVSIFGVLIGIQYFGIFGIVIGPLLLSYGVLTIEMFIEEYIHK